MTIQEKIASVNKLERIDSSIESCIKILEQELNKRKIEDPDTVVHNTIMMIRLDSLNREFNIMRGKK